MWWWQQKSKVIKGNNNINNSFSDKISVWYSQEIEKQLNDNVFFTKNDRTWLMLKVLIDTEKDWKGLEGPKGTEITEQKVQKIDPNNFLKLLHLTLANK